MADNRFVVSSAFQKINNKNSWNFDLIDQMGSIIKSDSTGSRGVNFQKVITLM
jgi:hypothetical protein